MAVLKHGLKTLWATDPDLRRLLMDLQPEMHVALDATQATTVQDVIDTCVAEGFPIDVTDELQSLLQLVESNSDIVMFVMEPRQSAR